MKAVVLKKAERLRERLSLIVPLATVTPRCSWRRGQGVTFVPSI
jgi:hypothetical protein